MEAFGGRMKFLGRVTQDNRRSEVKSVLGQRASARRYAPNNFKVYRNLMSLEINRRWVFCDPSTFFW